MQRIIDFPRIPLLLLTVLLAFGCEPDEDPIDPEEATGKETFVFKAIGVIHSPYTPETGAPKQGRHKPDTESRIEIYPDFVEGLKDLEAFSHILVFFAFDRSKGWHPLVKTPWDKEKTRRVRHPARPTGPIRWVFTAVELVKREGEILHVRGLDAYDGTPLLDLKPYSPGVGPHRRGDFRAGSRIRSI